MVLVCKYLVCHLAASCFLNLKPVVAKLLAAAVETGRTKGELQVHPGMSTYCMGLLLHRGLWKGAICYILDELLMYYVFLKNIICIRGEIAQSLFGSFVLYIYTKLFILFF